MLNTIYLTLRNLTPLLIRKKIGPFIALSLYIWRVYVIQKNTPKILSLSETLDKILKENFSVIRFGDGEISIIDNCDLSFQKKDRLLANQLKKIIQVQDQNIIICIPDIWGKLINFNSRSFWFTIHNLLRHGACWEDVTDSKKTYGNAFITRPYLSYNNKEHSKEIFNKIKLIWNNKNVVLIEGFGSRLGVGNDLFNNTKSLKRILCPSENAFEKYEEIKKEALKIDRNSMVLLSLGPTAKVLAYDLFLLGYRVIDIGHIDMEYEMYLRNSQEIVKVNYKYFNEINERSPEDCKDEKYTNQIIAKIV